MSEWVQVISTVGFPIAAFMMLAFYIYKVQTSFQKVIEQNTLAITKLCEHIKIEEEEREKSES